MSPRGPDLLCIGMPSSGTRWLYDQLSSHKDVAMPAFKELHFLDRGMRARSAESRLRNLKKRRKRRRHALLRRGKQELRLTWQWQLLRRIGIKSYGAQAIHDSLRRQRDRFNSDPDWLFLQTYLNSTISGELRRVESQTSKTSLTEPDRFSLSATVRLEPRHYDWYLSLFDPYKPMVTGDITPGYFSLDPEKIAQLHGYCPHAKLVMMVRHPAETFVSSVSKRVRQGYVSIEEIERRHGQNSDSAGTKADRFSRSWSASRAYQNWSHVFGEDAIQVVVFDDLISDPAGVRRALCQHVGLSSDDSDFGLEADHNRKQNRSDQEKARLDLNKEAIYRLLREETKRCQALFGGSTAKWRLE